MVSKKYVGDYRLENVPDRRGKLKTVPVYRGPLFRFKAEESRLAITKRRMLCFTAIESAALLVTMLLRAEILSRIYVVMPLILSILPTVLLWMGLYNLFTAGKSVPRDKCDRIHNRFAGWSIVLLALAALSLVGQITSYIGSASARGIPVTICTFAIMACAILIFKGRADLLMEEIPADP